jgi:hypothetical protein
MLEDMGEKESQSIDRLDRRGKGKKVDSRFCCAILMLDIKLWRGLRGISQGVTNVSINNQQEYTRNVRANRCKGGADEDKNTEIDRKHFI